MALDVKFSHLCELLEKMHQSSKEKKKKHLSKIIGSFREGNTSVGASLFTIARLLCPILDTDRKPYGVKEHTLAKVYIRILNLPPNGLDANKLLRFRSPAAGSSAGDFADVAYWVLKSRCRTGGLLTVRDVDEQLEKIATLHASNKPRGIDDELRACLYNMSAEEQKWFIRILLRDKVGLEKSLILNAIHPDAQEQYNMCHSLRVVCEKLQDPSKRLNEINVCLFLHCMPMRSERCDVLKVESILSKAPFYFVEKKHDGERFQIHIDNGLFKYFSRSGLSDSTDNFGHSIQSGTLTPHLAKQLDSNIRTCILDGEMMGWNIKLKCFVSHGQNFDVKKLKPGGIHQPCFCPFDVLMLNGDILTNKPVENRIESLKKLFMPLEGVIMDTPQMSVRTSSEVVKALNDAIDRQEEGLILKHPLSVYKPATRTGGWYKIKPEYTIGLTDELDVIIIGGYYGKGRHKANISHFLVGVAVTPEAEGSNPKEFHSMGKVGSGYTSEELWELSVKLSPHWESVKRAQMPNGIFWTKERPDVWIEPCNSIILQVKATEINYSDQYKTGFTLKFPRVVKVRNDKKWSECCTTSEFEKLRLANSGKLAIRHVSSTDMVQTSPTKRSRTKVAPVVGQDLQAADLTSIAVTGSRLKGREICVFNGNERISKQSLEKRIFEEGGTVVQQRGPETFCVVAGKKDVRLKNLLDKGGVDVVTVDWLFHVINGEKPLEWTPHDLLAMSSKTRIDMEQNYDSFCDSYFNPTSVKELKLSLQKVSEQDLEINLLPSEMGDIDVELFSGINEFAVFRCCVAHFISFREENNIFASELYKAMFHFQGGRISHLENPDLTHIVIDVKDYDSYNRARDLNQSRERKLHIVTFDWIESCWTSRRCLNEIDFHPKSLLYCES